MDEASGEAVAVFARHAVAALGVITRLEPEAFVELLSRQPTPLVVGAVGGFFTTTYRYLTSYKGLAFETTADRELELPADVELIVADSISAIV